MSRLIACICLIWSYGLLHAERADAANWGINTTAGLMQQPTSHYYHFIYGAEAKFNTTSEGFIVRASYLERPEFHDAGYADKDYGWFGLIGTKVTKTPDRGLYAYIGAGRMTGYVKADADYRGESGEAKNHYLITGLTAAMEYAFHLGPVFVAAEQQVFIGYVDNVQLNALVGWPYNYFQLKVGVAW